MRNGQAMGAGGKPMGAGIPPPGAMHPGGPRPYNSSKRQKQERPGMSAALTDYQLQQQQMMMQQNMRFPGVGGGPMHMMMPGTMMNPQLQQHLYMQRQAQGMPMNRGVPMLPTQQPRKNARGKRAQEDERLASANQSKKDSVKFHNVSAERRFFDQVKEFFQGNNSREAWGEFVRLMELYSMEAVTLKEMLSLMQELLGTTGTDLFEELKSLLSARMSYEGNGHEAWYGVPLCEVDFNQSRKCTPSYRALPAHYPRPLCGERSEQEASVLNDEVREIVCLRLCE